MTPRNELLWLPRLLVVVSVLLLLILILGHMAEDRYDIKEFDERISAGR